MEENSPLLPSMLDLQARTGGIVLAFIEVEPQEVSRYGIAAVAPAEDGLADLGEVVKVTDLVEKNLAVVGRYVLPGEVFDAIKRTKPGSGGEIQLTDAMGIMLNEGTPVHGIVYRGVRYDTGMPLGYLQAVVQLAAQRPDLGPAFKEWLAGFVASGGKPTGSSE
jgi:UTP--glucose-1-phosphate uridylyltransferase